MFVTLNIRDLKSGRTGRFPLKPLEKILPLGKTPEIIDVDIKYSPPSGKVPGDIIKIDKPEVYFYGTLLIRLSSKDRREFIREIEIRFDNSKHDGTDIHLNLDEIYRLGKHIKDKLPRSEKIGEFHMTPLGDDKTPRMIDLTVITSFGKGTHMRIGYYPHKDDIIIAKAVKDFMEKVKRGTLIKRDEKRMEVLNKKYYKSFTRRKANEVK
ncbi:MAG: hypothetical protein JXC85_06190 [Candidatus Aenigmarchaeota archaeon]|nr:hypothetical protein [Candidatus Aenigmarchaeota archaeon]